MAKRGSSGESLMLAIDKPKGLSSHDVVNRCRRVFGEKRIGHTGTLDPLASGLLCIAVGPATRLDAYLSGHAKTYEMDIAFGVATTTDDAEGEVINSGKVSEQLYDPVFASLTIGGLVGAGKQLPPVYSAIKVGGQKSYAAARRGHVIELSPRDFEVYSASLEKVVESDLSSLFAHPIGDDRSIPVWRVVMRVSGGTYMRSIARDLGKRFGCGAFVAHLRRIAVGPLSVDSALSLEQLEVSPRSALIDPLHLLGLRYAFLRDEGSIASIQNGNALDGSSVHLNTALPDCGYDPYCCTTQVFPSSDPSYEGEVIALLVDNRIKALYSYDAVHDRYVAKCVFPIGVERGSDL